MTRRRDRDSHAAPGVLASLFGSTTALPQMSEVQEEGRERGSTAFLNDSESRFRETFGEKESPADSNDKNAQSKNAQGKDKDKPTTIFGWSWRLQPRAEPASGDDPEKAGTGATKERKLVLLGPLYAGCGAALAGCEYWLLSSREPSSSLGFRSPPNWRRGELSSL
jgi:hypothetical protein